MEGDGEASSHLLDGDHFKGDGVGTVLFGDQITWLQFMNLHWFTKA